MNIMLKTWVRLYLFVALTAVYASATAAYGQSYAEGISEVLDTTTSTDLYTYTDTYITYDLAAYYSPYTAAQLLDNGTQVPNGYGETGATDYQDAELDGHLSVKTGDDYEVDGAHYLIELYTYYDPGSGNTYYENPGYYGFTDGYQSTGYDYTGGDGNYYTTESLLFLGYTEDAISTAVPQITGVSPAGGARGTSGQITITGSHLVDVFNGSTTPTVLSGSGLSLTTGSLSATQVTLNYSIDGSAATGARQFTLSNRFGQSEPQTFTIGDPSPIVGDVEPHIWPAGTVIPLTITGSGFGVAPTVTIAGVGVLTPNPAATGSDTSISTSVSIALDAPNGPATVTVQSHGSGGNGFVQGTPGQSSLGSNGAVIEEATPPPPIIQRNGTTITNQQTSVLVGEQVSLSVIAPSGFQIQSQIWSFAQSNGEGGIQDITGGFNVTSLDQVQSATQVTGEEAADPDTSQPNILFYFVNPGTTENVTVRVTYRLADGSSSPQVGATTTFSIGGPTGVTVTDNYPVAPVSIQQIPNPEGPGQAPYISLGTGGNGPLSNYGVVFTANNNNTVEGQGQNSSYEWVQLITSDSFNQIDQGGSEVCTTKLPLPLQDGGFPSYVGPTETDSPADPLSPTVGEIGGGTTFQSYLMWDPALPSGCQRTSLYAGDCTSIPVPIGILTWTYSRATINTLANQPNGTTSTKTCGAGVENAATFAPTVQFPQWGGTIPLRSTMTSIYNCAPSPH